MLSPVRPSVRPFVCLSHGWISQKRLKLGSRNFHHTVASSSMFLRDKSHPEIPTGSPERGHQTRVGQGKQAIFYLYASISPKRYEIRPIILLMINRKLHTHFRLAPRSMTLDDLELENYLFSSFKPAYLAKVYIHRCRALTFASAKLSCIFFFWSRL